MQVGEHLTEIISLVQSNPALILVVAPGNGQNTILPKALNHVGLQCCLSIDMGPQSGDEMDKSSSYASSILIRRHFLHAIAENHPITFCKSLILLEPLSSVDDTAILSLWRVAFDRGLEVPRLIISVSSLGPDNLFGDADHEAYHATYIVENVGYSVDYLYTERDWNPGDPQLYIEAVMMVEELHRTLEINEGSIVIFSPGWLDAIDIADMLKNRLEDAEILTEVPNEPSMENRRRIFSVAGGWPDIGNVGAMVDCMYILRHEEAASGGYTTQYSFHSRAMADMYSQYCSRTSDGFCCRMCTRAKLENSEQKGKIAVEYAPLYDVVREIIEAGLDPLDILHLAPKHRVIETSDLVEKLYLVGTEAGKFVSGLTLGPRQATLYWHWKQAGLNPITGLIVASIIDAYPPGYYSLPGRDNTQSVAEYHSSLIEYNKRYDKFRGYSDLDSALRMWNLLVENEKKADLGAIENRSIFAKENGLNLDQIMELLATFNLNGEFQPESVNPDEVSREVDRFMELVYGDLLLVRSRGKIYIDPLTGKNWQLDSLHTVNMFDVEPPKKIYSVLRQDRIAGRKMEGLIIFAIPAYRELPEDIVPPEPPMPGANMTEDTLSARAERVLSLTASYASESEKVRAPKIVMGWPEETMY